jgi:hypothetical protein
MPSDGDVRAVSFQVELNPIEKDQLPVSVVQVLPFGEVQIRDARENFNVSAISVLNILSHFGGQSVDMAIDYDHGMYYGDNNTAAGWGEKMWAVVPQDVADRISPFIAAYGEDRISIVTSDKAEDLGVYILVRWTEAAAEKIAAREYRYISPVVFFSYSGDAEYLWNAALVNSPAIDGMDALAASILPAKRAADDEGGIVDNVEDPVVSAAGATPPKAGAAPGTKPGNEEAEKETNMDLKAFAAMVRPEADVEAEDFNSEVFLAGVAEELSSLREMCSEVEALAAENVRVKAEMQETAEALSNANKEIEDLNSQIVESEKVSEAATIDQAIKDGLLAESQREWATENFEPFESLLGTLADKPQGPPQGKDVEAGADDTSLENGLEASQDVSKIKAYATEHGCSFEKAYVELSRPAAE